MLIQMLISMSLEMCEGKKCLWLVNGSIKHIIAIYKTSFNKKT